MMGNLEIVKIIVTTLKTKGDGTENDPVRRVTQWWSMDGNLLLEADAFAPSPSFIYHGKVYKVVPK
jgi:hypothetical protein